MLGEHVGGRDCHRTELMQGKHSEPELIAALEDKHHHIPPTYAELTEISRCTVGLLLDICKGETDALALVIGPEQRLLFGFLRCPGIHHVVGKVKMFGDDKLQVFSIILL